MALQFGVSGGGLHEQFAIIFRRWPKGARKEAPLFLKMVKNYLFWIK
jgi:hypothetical protein